MRQSDPVTPYGRAIVVAIVAAVTLGGGGGLAIGGSSAALAGSAADWSSHPGKEVTPDDPVCPPENETDVDNGIGNDTNVSGYQLRILYDGKWEATIVTDDTDVRLNGTGDERIPIDAETDERVAASATKADFGNETMTIQLLEDGVVIDEQERNEPGDVDNLDSSSASTVSAFEDENDSTFGSTDDTDSFDETGTDDGWTTFGKENKSSAFEDTTEDPFADDGDDAFSNDTFSNDTATASDDPFNDSDTTVSAFDDETNETDDVNETAADEECDPVEENTTTPTNDTNDSAFPVTTTGEAQVVFADQNTTGTSVVIESVTVPDSGFVVVHNTSLLQEGSDVRASIVGVSEKLDAEQTEDVEISLAHEIEESQTLIAVVYRDTDGDGEFEYDGTEEASDEPYLDDNGSAVNDDAYVTVPSTNGTEASVFEDENDSTGDSSTADTQDTDAFGDEETITVTPNATVNEANEAFTETNAPGFGIAVAIVTMGGAALLATRRNQ